MNTLLSFLGIILPFSILLYIGIFAKKTGNMLLANLVFVILPALIIIGDFTKWAAEPAFRFSAAIYLTFMVSIFENKNDGKTFKTFFLFFIIASFAHAIRSL